MVMLILIPTPQILPFLYFHSTGFILWVHWTSLYITVSFTPRKCFVPGFPSCCFFPWYPMELVSYLELSLFQLMLSHTKSYPIWNKSTYLSFSISMGTVEHCWRKLHNNFNQWLWKFVFSHFLWDQYRSVDIVCVSCQVPLTSTLSRNPS